MSLREVSRRAGVSVAAPSHHFGGKRGLMTAFAIEGLEHLEASIEGRLSTVGDEPSRRISAIARGYMEFATEHPEHFAVVFRPELYDERDPELREVGDRAFQVLAGAVDQAQRAGWRDSEDPLELAVVVWAAIHGLATFWVEGLVDERIRAEGPDHMVEATLRALGWSDAAL